MTSMVILERQFGRIVVSSLTNEPYEMAVGMHCILSPCFPLSMEKCCDLALRKGQVGGEPKLPIEQEFSFKSTKIIEIVE